ncbi:endo-1,3;1,4-beta-D-glucanase isoform X2 [Rutidosis leptorrhynchoides]|uniref:endo-1,3;1,4-beta-D-glucanase isoform X2 n=1 Tax=Rutidosis leptorrhynchoides TaxID=125765 RepID=UPI003A98FED3
MSGPECCENPPALAVGEQNGEVKQIASLNSYVSGDPNSKIAVVLISDIWGYEAPKLRNIADKVASAGYYTVVPDFFHGDPMTPGTQISDWLKNHAPEQGVGLAKPVVQALKEKGASKVGAAGFCWGGVKVPIAILGAEIDKMSPPEVVKEFEAALKAKPEVDHFVKIYPGVSHGWTCRYKDEDEAEVKTAVEAHHDLVEWFGKRF